MKGFCEQQKMQSDFLHFFLHLKSPGCLYFKRFSCVHSACIATSFASSLRHHPVRPTLPSGNPLMPQCSPPSSASPPWPRQPLGSLRASLQHFGQSQKATCASAGKEAASDKDELSCLSFDRMEQGLFPLHGCQAWLKLIREVLKI